MQEEAPFVNTEGTERGEQPVLVRTKVRRETPQERTRRIMNTIWRVRHFRPTKSKLSVCTYGKV